MAPHFLGTSFYKSPIGLVVKVSYLKVQNQTPSYLKSAPGARSRVCVGCGVAIHLRVLFSVSQLLPGRSALSMLGAHLS